MEIDILDSLEDLGYSGTIKDDESLKKALELGPKSTEFTEVIEWLSKELQAMCNLDGFINAITDPDESSTFLLEVSSFLKELGCPYDSLMDGPISQRLITTQSRILLIDYLCTELQASRLNFVKNESKKQVMNIEMEGSTEAKALGSVLNALNIDIKLLENPEEIFYITQSKVEEMLPKLPDTRKNPVLTETLSSDQWMSLQKLQNDMNHEYAIRREMLLTRLDVTVQSFKWGENAEGKDEEISKMFLPARVKLKAKPAVDLSDLLAAREDVMMVEKTSSAALVKNTKSSLNRILIGRVPDRGGRPKEQKPPVEMPNWQKRTQGPSGGHFRGGHGRQFRGKGSGPKKKGAFDAAGSY